MCIEYNLERISDPIIQIQSDFYSSAKYRKGQIANL